MLVDRVSPGNALTLLPSGGGGLNLNDLNNRDCRASNLSHDRDLESSQALAAVPGSENRVWILSHQSGILNWSFKTCLK
jgi:hypothetical protein